MKTLSADPCWYDEDDKVGYNIGCQFPALCSLLVATSKSNERNAAKATGNLLSRSLLTAGLNYCKGWNERCPPTRAPTSKSAGDMMSSHDVDGGQHVPLQVPTVVVTQKHVLLHLERLL